MPMVDGVHGRDVGQERLRRADVTGGLVTTNMLLPRLKAQAIPSVSLLVSGRKKFT